MGGGFVVAFRRGKLRGVLSHARIMLGCTKIYQWGGYETRDSNCWIRCSLV